MWFTNGVRAVLIEKVQMLDSTFLMTTETMIDDLMSLLLMLAISLWI
jgi:hypothetical protein